MDKYTIYCTEEQTKKALELGAPIYVYDELNSKATDGLDVYLDNKVKLNNNLYAEIPTAEQMIGWLEEQNIRIDIDSYISGYDWTIWNAEKDLEYTIEESDRHYNSRREATLEVIDAALEYLSNKE